jgi:hypothetical protein
MPGADTKMKNKENSKKADIPNKLPENLLALLY